MKLYRTALLRKEFPFLDKLFPADAFSSEILPQDVTAIRIQRGDRALMIKRGTESSYSWSDGGTHDFTFYFAIWTDKQGLQHVQKLQSAGYAGTGSGSSVEWDAANVGEQLFANNITPDYIVECVHNGTDANGNGSVTNFWTIFKMRDFDQSAYHQMQVDMAAAAIKAEIAAVWTGA